MISVLIYTPCLGSCEFKGYELRPPKERWPFLGAYLSIVPLNNPLIRPYFLGGWHGGGVAFDSHGLIAD